MAQVEASRRNVIAGLAAAGVAAPLVAACGSDAEPEAGGSATGIPTADIPVGGGKIFADDKVVVTQPTDGDFKAFTAVCTHQACLVSSVKDGAIQCTCHGSRYSIADGSVTGGPAPEPLAEKTVSVNGDTLSVN